MSRPAGRILALIMLVAQLCGIGAPIQYACAMGGGTLNVELPIDEIEGLIQELNDAGSQLVGEAGVQMRESIRELSDEMRLRIDQIRDASKEVIVTAVTELRRLLNDLIRQARALLVEIRAMITGAIECISQQLAERIAQLKTAILELLEAVSTTIKDVVNHIYVRATQIVDTGTNRVAIVIDSTLNAIAKIILVVLVFVLLFWLVRAIWAGKFPKAPALRFGIPALVVLLVVGAGYLLFSKSALASILGTKVTLPKSETMCEKGGELYDQFMGLRNANASDTQLRQVGNEALENLNWCVYASMSPEVSQGTQQKIDEIAAVLYPPPPPPSASQPVVSTCPPAPGGHPGSVNPGWLVPRDIGKLFVIERLRDRGVLRTSDARFVPDTTRYFRDLRQTLRVDARVISVARLKGTQGLGRR